MTAFTIALVFSIIQPTASLAVSSTYSGTLSVASPAFIRPTGLNDSYYFYDALQFNTSAGGLYTFSSTSSTGMGTFGCLYQKSFDPSNPSENLIIYNDGGNYQFHFTNTLQTERTYILVVTTNTRGDYTAKVDGPGSVVMTRLLPVISSFNGSLSSSSANFSRPFDFAYLYDYYYQAMHITNYKRGMYTFRSVSTIHSYGLLYNGSVNPNSPRDHCVASDDSSGGNNQFLIAYFLETNGEYTLIFTTEYDNVTGNFTIISTGPGPVTLVPYIPKPFDFNNIFGIAYSAFVAGVVLLSILTRQRRKN